MGADDRFPPGADLPKPRSPASHLNVWKARRHSRPLPTLSGTSTRCPQPAVMQIIVDFSIWCLSSVWGHATGTVWVARKPRRTQIGVPDVPQDLIEWPTEVQFIT